MLNRAVRVARALSLDVALGGACSMALAAATTGAAVLWPVWVLLPGAIWVVYTVDHLLDARRTGDRARAFRHRFHLRHARPLAIATAVVAAAGGGAALAFLPRAVLVAGVAVAAGAGVHLAIAQRPGWAARLPKELSAAAIYTAGVWCAPVLLAPKIAPVTWSAIALFFVAALANLLLNALMERHQDASDGAPSWALAFGERATVRAINGLAVCAACLAIACSAAAPLDLHGVFLVLLVLGVFPASLLRLRRHVEAHELYRAVGDLAFLLAVIPAVLR
jgi:4-hydroxybenzoate polyprenyltransferase